MGIYINKGNEGFRVARNGEYVDKSGLISMINNTLETDRMYSCVTRCRRFGKSMAAKMLCAYYDKSCDSRELFRGLEIEKNADFEKHLNKYPVIYIDITDFTTRYRNDKNIVERIQKDVKAEIKVVLNEASINDDDDLMAALVKVYNRDNQKFVIIIDEWDAILREFDDDKTVKNAFIDLLRRLFKGSESDKIFAGAYITGILPIKKYNTESALNNFREYSMVKPGKLAKYLGFTKDEVERLCEKHDVSFDTMEQWYDGYRIGQEKSMFNPFSVIEAIYSEEFKSYWSSTGAFDRVTTYIQMNYDGLKDDIINMLSGNRSFVETVGFSNDLKEINSKDDVLTVLVHLGYLSYDAEAKECYIPNKEVGLEMEQAVKATNWSNIAQIIEQSRKLLEATLRGDTQAVAGAIDKAHDENTSILSYNDENSLSCVISMAYIYARNNYVFHREYATGKGFADIVLIPRKNFNSPALVIELKFNKAVNTAIDQIKQKQYPEKISEYTGEIMLVGVSYDKEKKTHGCEIEIFFKYSR